MTDSETPGFKVVDRRRAASESAATEPDSVSGQSTSNTPGVEPAATQAEPRSDPSTAAPSNRKDSESEQTQNAPQSDSDQAMPDPAMLLTFVAMQMDVHTLATALTAVFDGHAWRAMGLVADPTTGELKQDLPAAQLAIDCVQFLLGKIEASLSEEERRELHRRLNDLRMNYLAKLREG